MARVLLDDDYPINDKYLASNERVSFIDLPYYVGPIQYLKVRRKLNKIVAANLMSGCVYICRVPGEIGTLMARHLKKWDALWGGSGRRPMGRICSCGC